MLNKALFLPVVLLGVMAALPVLAAPYNADLREEPRNLATGQDGPPPMRELQEVRKSDAVTSRTKSENLDNVVDEEKDLALKIRRDSMREAAISYGARGGLAWRTKQIMEELSRTEAALDRVFNFRRLLIKAPSNMNLEPPIISEALNNFLVTPSGDEAAVADTIYHISRQARIVSSPRNWRQYLERVWDEILPPPDILLPETEAERKSWRRWVREGWSEGYEQADEIFQADLNRMVADFEGMVRYRMLLAQNKVSAPYATMVDRGISGVEVETTIGDSPHTIVSEMRVGDRAIRITQPVSLRPDTQDEWSPPLQTAP